MLGVAPSEFPCKLGPSLPRPPANKSTGGMVVYSMIYSGDYGCENSVATDVDQTF